MELIVALATKFWQWSILIAVVLITFLINLLDKKKVSKTTFVAETMPDLKPVPIKTTVSYTHLTLPTITGV